MGAAPGGRLEGDPGTQGIPSDVEPGHARPVQLVFNGIRQGRRGGRNPCGESGGVSEAGEVEGDDVIVVAEGLVDRLPADRGLSDARAAGPVAHRPRFDDGRACWWWAQAGGTR